MGCGRGPSRCAEWMPSPSRPPTAPARVQQAGRRCRAAPNSARTCAPPPQGRTHNVRAGGTPPAGSFCGRCWGVMPMVQAVVVDDGEVSGGGQAPRIRMGPAAIRLRDPFASHGIGGGWLPGDRHEECVLRGAEVVLPRGSGPYRAGPAAIVSPFALRVWNSRTRVAAVAPSVARPRPRARPTPPGTISS